MSDRSLLSDRPVFVVGIGMHPYQRRSDITYVELGITAVRAALVDAAVTWSEVEPAYLSLIHI